MSVYISHIPLVLRYTKNVPENGSRKLNFVDFSLISIFLGKTYDFNFRHFSHTKNIPVLGSPVAELKYLKIFLLTNKTKKNKIVDVPVIGDHLKSFLTNFREDFLQN